MKQFLFNLFNTNLFWEKLMEFCHCEGFFRSNLTLGKNDCERLPRSSKNMELLAMTVLNKTLTTLFVLFLSTTLFAQDRNPKELLDIIQSDFEKIKDYSVDIEIIIDMDFVDAPNSNAKLFFKQPDKVKIESEGFAIIPKQGLTFSPSELLTDSYSAIYIKSEILDSFMVDIIKVIPLEDSSDILLSTLWVDPLYSVIRKIESVTKKMGTITIYLEYGDKVTPSLPSTAKFFFNTTKSGHGTMFKNNDKSESNKEKGKLSGSVIIKYSNYLLNQNLDDSFFIEEDEVDF